MNKHEKIDHIVYSVFDLEDEIDRLEQCLGIRPVFGGYHKTQGTKNALLDLGNACYLELLAIDTDNTKIPPPRWMGIDFLTEPKITRWALKSANLDRDSRTLQEINPKMGHIQGGSRKIADGSTLEWELSMPLADPEVEILPFLIDWKDPMKHPTAGLQKGCKLEKIYGSHPNPDILQPIMKQLGVALQIDKGPDIQLKLLLKGPKGSIQL